MPSSSVRGLLVALVACVQLVLAPALRPKACGAALPGGHACCSQPAELGSAELDSADPVSAGTCCCGDVQDAASPTEPGSPTVPGTPADRPDGGDPCRCHHAPDPWLPADDQAPPSVESGARSVNLPPVLRFVSLPSKSAPCEARAGPPGRPGPALHLRHCVFLI